MRFHHLTSDGRYGIGNVWAIEEDHEGFIWIGTEDGLFKYDGYDLTAFRHRENDSTCLSSNMVICIKEDRNKNLWVGTFGGGLNLYDRKEDRFYQFKHDSTDPGSIPHDRVKSIVEDHDGNLWFCTEGGGIATCPPFNGNVGELEFSTLKHEPGNDNSIRSNDVTALINDGRGNLYIGSFGKGVSRLDTKTGKFTHFLHDQKKKNSLSDNRVLEIFIDSKKRIWIGTLDGGLDLFLPDENRFINYRTSKSTFTLSNNQIASIAEDHDGNVWVGTDDGLNCFINSQVDIPRDSFLTFLHEPLNQYSILSNSIKNLYVDSRNSLWVCSYFGGLNIYNKSHYKFQPISQKIWKEHHLSHNNVTSFAEDSSGNLWIGTDGGGLNLLKNGVENIYSDQYEKIELINPITGENQKKIKSIALDQNGILWVGVWAGGLFRYDPATGQTLYYGRDDPNSPFQGYNVLSVEIDTDNDIWVGTFTSGVFRYAQERNEFISYGEENNLKGDRFNDVFIDSKDRKWVGGEWGGLQLYDMETDIFESIVVDNILNEKISIVAINETSEGKILIGTVSSNIILYDPEENTAEIINEEEGFPENIVHGMIEDNSGKIWCSTNVGLIVYDPETHSSFKYDHHDGLQGNQFNNNSYLKCSNGLFLFGGTKGWNGFYPDSIKRDKTRPKIAFTDFWLDGGYGDNMDQVNRISAEINSDKAIELSHDQNSFEISFAALEFSFSQQNQYAYMLEGLDDNWRFVSGDRKANFTNLFPGSYKLMVKATNKDGFWFEKENPKTIIIEHAWWQTLWFKIGMGAFILLLGFLIYWWRVSYLVKQRNKLENLVHERTQQLNNTNRELQNINRELASKNNEIIDQNRELTSQNIQINTQREELERTQKELKEINEKLELRVEQRTQKLNKTIKQLDKTVLELDRFVYSASHDLSAPLKSIRGLLQIAKVKSDHGSIQECLDYIGSSIGRLEDVIKSLVEYSRNTHNELKVDAFNISELINEIINELAYWPEFKKVCIYNEVDQDTEISTDRARLKIVLNNLISNGLKYADFDKNQPFIKIELAAEGNSHVLKISDNGIGIEKEYLSKIFDMYFRASERSQGSGLGLFIVKEAMNKIGGKISIKSEKDRGTEFTINVTSSHLVSENA